jgi:ATP-binding cassette subfamily B (MDR/TAP) protein 1
MAMRERLYRGFLTKHIGWFDNRDNAPGILTSALANDTSVLNGASTESIAVMTEATFAILIGLIIGFIYDWKIALVSMVCTPFFAIGAGINAKF